MSCKRKLKDTKYKSSCTEIRMWNMKCKIIPVTIGANETATNGLKKGLEAIPGKYSIDSLQKTAMLGTSHTIQKVLLSER